jgi:methionyl-tRNA synthetase
MFRQLLATNGYLYPKVTPQMYSPEAGKFLPDRYVEGTCPNCGYTGARGDQCDNCNTLFESAAQLINPRSKRDNTSLVLRDTEHFFLDLPAIANDALGRMDPRRQGVLAAAGHQLRPRLHRRGLIGRAVTRDMDWGIPVPVEGFDNKVLYVWFEAVIGYLSATIEWAQQRTGSRRPVARLVVQPDARTVYFIGKDNIPFPHRLLAGATAGRARPL